MSPQDATEAISQRLSIFIAAQRESCAEWGEQAEQLIDAAGAACTGGKGLRGDFCLTGWWAVAGAGTTIAEPLASVIDAAASLELFHAAALVHDDIIDNADLRRGRPAAHRAFEAMHRAQGWSADASAFGRSGAIILGDLLLAFSDDLFESALAQTTAPVAMRTREVYAQMRREVTVGQFLDVAEESAWSSQPDERHAGRALRVASLKSALYSVQRPLLIGAALAEADAAQSSALERFGHPLGIAFQLRDDILGVYGEQAHTGKPVGGDLREGKRTVLIAYTREALSASPRRVFDELLGNPELDDEQIGWLQRTIADTGARDRLEQLIDDYAREANRALSGARLDNAAVARLRDLLRAATRREG